MENNSTKQKKRGVFSDGIFLFLFAVMLLVVLAGGPGAVKVAKALGFGEGWPEIFQGGLGMICLVLLAVRGVQIGKKLRG